MMDLEALGTVDAIIDLNGMKKRIILHGVVYSPHLLYNLVYVSKSQKKGYRMNIHDDHRTD